MYYLRIDELRGIANTVNHDGMTPIQIAKELFRSTAEMIDAGFKKYEPDHVVKLSHITFVEHIPPRCRKPRSKRVDTPVGEFRVSQLMEGTE